MESSQAFRPVRVVRVVRVHRSPSVWAVVCACLLAAACASPIGVDPADPRSVHRSLTANALSSGELSEDTRNLLRRANLLDLYEEQPDLALTAAHALLRERAPSARRRQLNAALVGLSEASFLHASRSGDQRYYLASAIYAWAYLFGSLGEVDPLDSRLSLAANLYNRSLALALVEEGSQEIQLESREYELPWGTIEARFDEEQLRWGIRRFTRFTSLADLKVRGMNNRYRTAGLGVAVAAYTDTPEGKEARKDLLFENALIDASIVLHFEDLAADVESGRFRAHFEVHPGTGSRHVEARGRQVPLELDRTAAMALILTEEAPWKREIAGFFQGDLALEEGLTALVPHQPGRIPVVLVHGTASSITTWANFLNDLVANDELREQYEFFFFTYNTGAPIAYSAWLLRTALDGMLETLDPEGTDPALRRAVVIGHSQGGLLTKLLTVDSGDSFWKLVSDEPFESVELDTESRHLLEGSLFVKPHPAVERVVFIATPHRGSFLASYGLAQFVGGLVRMPANVARSVGTLVTQNPEALAVRDIGKTSGAIANMSPNSPFLGQLVETPIAPGIHAHSIIAMKDLTDMRDGSDGVVRYESAHLDDVDSEVVVESGHSCLSRPEVVDEATRILLMHLRYGPPSR